MWLLEPVGLALPPNLGSFHPLVLGVLFQPHPLSPLLWDSEDVNVILPVIFPQVPEILLIFPSGCFVSVTQIGSLLLFRLPVY